MAITLLGMVMLIREMQSEKALSPILVTPFGMLMFMRDLQ